ncbi:MAG TPA: addiction module toxin, HicA family [Desulfobulbaceae bacterium]|nr:addiction module toxin, HicA family [Desulfobulbaceae bacterium]
MTTWPTLNSTELIRALKKADFQLVRQKRSHARFEHPDGRSTTVPIHGSQDIGRGLLR